MFCDFLSHFFFFNFILLKQTLPNFISFLKIYLATFWCGIIFSPDVTFSRRPYFDRYVFRLGLKLRVGLIINNNDHEKGIMLVISQQLKHIIVLLSPFMNTVVVQYHPHPPPPLFPQSHNPVLSFIKVAYVYEPSLLIKVFTRLTDGITTDQQTLPGTVSARYIRFHPITQYEWNTLRVEVYKGELVVKRSVVTCRIRKPDSDNVTKKE